MTDKAKIVLPVLLVLANCMSGCSQSVVVENEKNLSKPEITTVTEVTQGTEDIVKNYTYVAINPEDKSFIIPETIEENGEILYYKGDAEYSSTELMMGVSKVIDVEVSELEDVESKYEYISEITGEKYILDNSYIYHGDREIIKRPIEETIEYGFSNTLMDIPKEKQILYYSDVTEADEEITGELIDSGISDEGYIEDSPIRGTFVYTDDNTYLWQLGDKEIVLNKNSEKPIWDGYEKDILDSLGLDENKFKIVEASWGTEEMIDGQKCKKAQYSIESYGYKQFAVYRGIGRQYGYKTRVLYYTDAERANANIEDVNKLYSITVTVHYTKEAPLMALLFAYKGINSDVVGVVSIADTVLKHPVCVSQEDEAFYLRRDLYKEDNNYGVPFVAIEHSFEKPSYNNVIYGHNICKTGHDVFADIPMYSDMDFYRQHRYIQLVTEKGVSLWDIFAYCVLDEANDNFDYYNHKYFLSKREFDEYMDEIQKRNQLDVDARVSIKDTFLTLSTCSLENWGTGTNRCFVMAKKVYIQK